MRFPYNDTLFSRLFATLFRFNFYIDARIAKIESGIKYSYYTNENGPAALQS